jgi:protein-glutamine gamma-glutamyltransferase
MGQHPSEMTIILSLILAVAWAVKLVGIKYDRWLKILLIGASFGLVYVIHETLRGLLPGVAFLSLMSAVKTFELNDKRDHYIFLMLSILVLVGHLLSVDSLLFVGYMIFLGFVFFLLLFISSSRHAFRQMSKKYWKDLLLIFALAIPQAFVLFLLFPRFYVGGYSQSTLSSQSRIGFIDEINPGEWTEMVRDRTPMFWANFPGVARPMTLDLYWRGAVLQHTDGFRWRVGRVPDDLEQFAVFSKNARAEFSYQVNFAHFLDRRLFVLPNTFKIDLRSSGTPLFQPGFLFVSSSSQTQPHRYEAFASLNRGNQGLSEEERALYLQTPTISNRMRQFVARHMEEHETDKARVDALMRHFQQGPFHYTLDAGSFIGRFPEDEFFFQRRRGFCEHYASVTGLLLRLMGIPTRLITGFQGGHYNPVGDYVTIRGEDAHAWVEVYLEDTGWTLIDPVRFIAPHRIEYGAYAYFRSLGRLGDETREGLFDGQLGWLQRLSFTVEAYYYQANLFFTSYRTDQQRSLLGLLGLNDLRPFRLLIVSALVLLIFSGLMIAYLKSKSVYKPSLTERAVQELYRLLAHGGPIDKGVGECTRSYWRRKKTGIPQTAYHEQIEQLVTTYERLRYGPVAPRGAQKDFYKAVKKLSSTLTY